MRFSIVGLLGLVAVAAVGIGALSNPNFVWTYLLYAAWLALLSLGLVVAVNARGSLQAFWIGFALAGFAWHYLSETESGFDDSPLSVCIPYVAAALGIEPVELWDPFAAGASGIPYYNLDALQWIIRVFAGTLIAVAGGILGRYCYGLRQEQEAGVAPQSR